MSEVKREKTEDVIVTFGYSGEHSQGLVSRVTSQVLDQLGITAEDPAFERLNSVAESVGTSLVERLLPIDAIDRIRIEGTEGRVREFFERRS